jgi:hypothetical protein
MEFPDRAPLTPYSLSEVPSEVEVAASVRVPAPPGYISPRSRASWATWVLAATITVDLLMVLALGAQRSLLNRGAGQITLAEWHTSAMRIRDLAIVEVFLYVATAVVFLRWLHRSYANLVALGARELRFSPRWAVGYWFVPIVNLVRPKQTMDELWRQTTTPDGRPKEGTWLTMFWWGAFLVGGVTTRVGTNIHAHSISDLKNRNTWWLVSTVLYVASAALAYRLVRAITARQDLRVLG